MVSLVYQFTNKDCIVRIYKDDESGKTCELVYASAKWYGHMDGVESVTRDTISECLDVLFVK